MAREGEFLVCVGSTAAKRLKVRAHIVAIGPVHFRGAGAKGKSFERTFEVEPNGLLRVECEDGRTHVVISGDVSEAP